MAPTVASTVVDRPAAEVFAYATDPAHFPEWQHDVIDGHLDPPGPPQVRREVRDHPAHRRSGPDRHLRADPHRRTQEAGACGASTDPSGPPSTSPWNP